MSKATGLCRIDLVSTLNELFTTLTLSFTIKSALECNWQFFRFFHYTERPFVDFVTREQTLNESQTVSLFCNGTGVPTPKITWSKNGGDNRELAAPKRLVIHNARKSDEGEYRCTISNGRQAFDARASSYVKVVYCKYWLLPRPFVDSLWNCAGFTRKSCQPTEKLQIL